MRVWPKESLTAEHGGRITTVHFPGGAYVRMNYVEFNAAFLDAVFVNGVITAARDAVELHKKMFKGDHVDGLCRDPLCRALWAYDARMEA